MNGDNQEPTAWSGGLILIWSWFMPLGNRNLCGESERSYSSFSQEVLVVYSTETFPSPALTAQWPAGEDGLHEQLPGLSVWNRVLRQRGRSSSPKRAWVNRSEHFICLYLRWNLFGNVIKLSYNLNKQPSVWACVCSCAHYYMLPDCRCTVWMLTCCWASSQRRIQL